MHLHLVRLILWVSIHCTPLTLILSLLQECRKEYTCSGLSESSSSSILLTYSSHLLYSLMCGGWMGEVFLSASSSSIILPLLYSTLYCRRLHSHSSSSSIAAFNVLDKMLKKASVNVSRPSQSPLSSPYRPSLRSLQVSSWPL